MQRTVATVLATIAAIGCASSGRVVALETRVIELERTQRQRDVQIHDTLMRVEGELARLSVSMSHSPDTASAIAEIRKKLAELETRIARPPAPRRAEPLPDQVYAVAITGDPVKGPADALVTVVRAGEYACPYCEKVRATLDQLAAAYPRDVRIVYKSFVVHPAVATDAAAAGCAANRQGKYWELDALLWDKAFKTRQFDMAHLEELAREAGLDLARFRADVKDPCPAEMRAEQIALSRIGVGATPVFFINGRYLVGAQPVESFKVLVDEELAKAQDRIKHGTRRKDYYDAWIVKKGLTQMPSPSPSATDGTP